MSVLYISYDGMLEPLGESQVLAYLKPISVDRVIHLISFEKVNDWVNLGARERLKREINASGIVWHPLRYHKSPIGLSTAWDIICGIVLGLWLVFRYRLRIVHARSYVPSTMALAIKRITGVKYLFDMRGFWADEKLDSGWSHDGQMYRVAKGFEKRFLLAADHIVSLTQAGVIEIQRFRYLHVRMPPITVIPTCADLDRFKPTLHEQKGTGLVIGYVGSVRRYLFDEVVECFAIVSRLKPDSRFLIVNRGEHVYIRERLAASGLLDEKVELISASPVDMPRQIARMDASIYFTKPTFSKKAMAPTKLAELLGCGVPCLGNYGVGDMAEVLEGEGVGIALTSFDQASLKEGVERLLALIADPLTVERCVAAAHKYFSLDEGVKKYQAIYGQLNGDTN